MRTHDREEAGREARDEVFAGARAHDRVVRTGHGGPVIRRHHQADLEELEAPGRQPTPSRALLIHVNTRNLN